MRGVTGIPVKSTQKQTYQSSRNPILNPMGKSGGNSYEPIVDMNLSEDFLAKRYQDYHGRHITIEKSPPLPPIESSTFRGIFNRKIESCCQMCNFFFIDADVKAKAVKTAMLEQILHFLKTEDQSSQLQIPDINRILEMVQRNICHSIKQFDDKLQFNESCPSILIPQWAHASLAYDILLQLLRVRPEAFTLEYVDRILYLLNSSDANERTKMKFFVGGLCITRPELREQMMIRMIKLLISHQQGVVPPFAVGSVLEILMEMFTWKIPQAEEIHAMVFRMHIIPLIADKYMCFFMKELHTILTHFMEISQVQVNVVVDAVIKYWPKTRLSKQIQLLGIMSSAIPKMSQRDFAPRIVKMFAIYSQCSLSPSSKLAEAALSIWDSHEIQAIIGIFSKQVFPLIAPSLVRIAKEHWNESIRRMAIKAVAFITKTDHKFNADAISALKAIDMDQFNNWSTIIRAASKNDLKLRIDSKMSEIDAIFRQRQYTTTPGGRNRDIKANMSGAALPRIITPKLISMKT